MGPDEDLGVGTFFVENTAPVDEVFALVEEVIAASPLTEMAWHGGKDLSELAGQPVRFRFRLTDGSLYAFWVSLEKSGESHGYVGSGGPGFTGPTDTLGIKACKPLSLE